MLTLGLVLLRGKGGPRNPRRAAQLLARASRLGNDSAAWILAHDYEKGLLVRRNLRKALEWNCFRAERGDVSAMRSAERLAEKHGLELPPRRVTAWYRTAAERGDRDALYWLGHRLSDGAGVRRNPRAAYSAWRRAANLGKASAYYMLGWAHEYGEGVRPSWPRALACYREAARRGDDDACYEIASYYRWERKDSRLRVPWLRKAMELGHNVARCELGIHYIYGDGVRQDMGKASRLYRQSAEHGYSRAMYLLGLCYLEGDGIRRDRGSARLWFERAVAAAEKEEDRETVRDARKVLAELARNTV
jgi:TPR repeat protein